MSLLTYKKIFPKIDQMLLPNFEVKLEVVTT